MYARTHAYMPAYMYICSHTFHAIRRGAKMISATRRIFYMQNLKPSYLNVATSIFDETGARMISASRHIFHIQNLKPS